MSTRYPGGFITKDAVAPTPSAATGIWTLDQQMQAQKAGTWPFGGPFTYIEDVFSTWLYTGTSATQTITNGIDLAGSGGLAWTKYRSGTNAAGHFLADSVRGIANTIQSNTEAGQQATSYYTAFNSNGFSISSTTEINYLNTLYASWTFRKQTKFFDIITYTGNGTSGTNIAHNLGSTPGCVMVKSTSTGRRWAVYHRGNGATPQNNFLCLNKTQASITSSVMWNDTAPTSTVFTLGSGTVVDAPTGEVTSTNENGVTYVAYLFAHDAGGFGLTGTDNVISCAAYTTDGSGNATVNLGYEPQWLLTKWTSSADNWHLFDDMRGFSINVNGTSGNTNDLYPNAGSAEVNRAADELFKTSTGFNVRGSGASRTYVYIAIRRGPMKVPTDATKVFTPIARNGTGTNTIVTGVGFPSDLALIKLRSSGNVTADYDRLRGSTANLQMNVTDAEAVYTGETVSFDQQNGFGLGPSTSWEYTNRLASPNAYINWLFRRAPGYFDVVCYTGTGVTRTVTHNLGVAPELMIIKSRSAATDWRIYSAAIGAGSSGTIDTGSFSANGALYWNSTAPTSTVFTLGSGGNINTNAATFVAYLFATCAGVSKVGSYTGTGATQTINCGFGAGGARFVLVKRTDSTGDWYVWDTARGMVSGTDPSLLFNTTAAEVNANSIYTIATGFQIVSTAAGINASGGTYIFLAIA